MNKKTGFGLALLAVGAVLMAAQSRRKKQVEQAEAERKALEAQEKTSKSQQQAAAAYTLKVQQFQRLVGLTADGIVGRDTLAAAAKLGFTTLNASNIAAAIAAVTKQKSQVLSQSDQIKRATQIYNAMGSGVPARVRLITRAPAVYLDKSKSAWVNTGGYFNIAQGATFYKSALKNDPRTNGVFVADVPVYKNGTSGATEVRTMKFGVENIYV